jgi:hypothetical protein
MTLRKGKSLYTSDKKYLEKKLNTEFTLVEKHAEIKKPESELLESGSQKSEKILKVLEQKLEKISKELEQNKTTKNNNRS